MSDSETAELFPASVTVPTGEDATPAAGILSAADTAGAEPGPRVRWAGIVWGVVLAAVAVAGIALSAAPERVDDLGAWVQDLQNLQPTTVVAYALIALGAVALVTGLVGLLRRAQRAAAQRRTS